MNVLLKQVSAGQGPAIRQLERDGAAALQQPDATSLGAFARAKDRVQAQTQLTEKVWMFYFNLFDQRTGPFRDQLLAMDRIALDCYRACYMGLGKARSIPTPPPMAYVEAGYGPATYRRGVKLTKLGKRANPFPLVKLPYHRLVNPWSLGAVPHEIGHNLQNDLSLWPVAPHPDRRSPHGGGNSARRHQGLETLAQGDYADLIGALLIGPTYVTSLFDIVGKAPERVALFSASGVHPTSSCGP